MAIALLLTFACMECGSATNNATPPEANEGGFVAGASYNCPSSEQSPYMTYGLDVFFAINASIFENLMNSGALTSATTPLGSSFTDLGNLAAFEGNFAVFFVCFFGGPMEILYTDGVEYYGSSSLPPMNITPTEYNYFVSEMIVPALASNGVAYSDISSCFVPALLKLPPHAADGSVRTVL